MTNLADMDPPEEAELVYEGNDIMGLGPDNDFMLTRLCLRGGQREQCLQALLTDKR